MTWFPPWPVIDALAAAVLLPCMVAVLSHGPWKVADPERRFWRACIIILAGWALCLPLAVAHISDVVAGALILATALVAEFTIWTLVAWGFTISLLLALSRARRPLTMDEWIAAYTGGRSVHAFSRDRLQMLFRAGLATNETGEVLITPGRGRIMAWLAHTLRAFFGVRQ